MKIGIDLGGTKIAAVLLDDDRQILDYHRLPTPQGDYAATLAAVLGLLRKLQKQAPEASIGIATPGTLLNNGLLVNSNSQCLNHQPIKADLESALGCRVGLANDANCFALSEATDGAAKGHDMVLGLILGTGVGAGVVCRGSIWSGAHGLAGEWGHNVLQDSGPECYCGKRGCVETFLSGPGMSADFLRYDGRSASAEDIAEWAEHGDVAAQSCVQRYVQRLAKALSVVVNVLDPHCIVLGGGLSKMSCLYDLLPQLLREQVFHPNWQGLIVENYWGDDSGVRGAACLV